MSPCPLITIGMTCYNAVDSIGRAIESAQAQDWEDTEILVVDDASSDESVAVIKEKIKDIPNARMIVHDVNRGVAAARNTLVAQAKGEFIAFFDDDDTSDATRIRCQYERIHAYENETGNKKIACFASVRRSYSNGYAPHYPAIGSRPKIPVGNDIVAYHLYLDRDPDVFYGGGTPCMSFMARVDLIKELGGFDPNLRRNEDGEFTIRLGLSGGAAVGCPEILVYQTSSGGVDKRPVISLESDLYIIEKYRDILIKQGRYFYARVWVRMKYHHHSGHVFRAIGCFLVLLVRHPILAAGRFIRRAPRRLLHEWLLSRHGGAHS